MLSATWLVLSVVGATCIAWAGLMLWGWVSGQFKDAEGAKFVMTQTEGQADDAQRNIQG